LLPRPNDALALALGDAQRQRAVIGLPKAAVGIDHNAAIIALAESVGIPLGIESRRFELRVQFVLAEGAVMESDVLHARRRPPVEATLDANEVTWLVGAHDYILAIRARAVSRSLFGPS
jgi:hypothetical protein